MPLAFLVAILFSASPLFAVPLWGQSQTTETRQALRVAKAMPISQPPKIDGKLDDPEWSLAEPITDFRQ